MEKIKPKFYSFSDDPYGFYHANSHTMRFSHKVYWWVTDLLEPNFINLVDDLQTFTDDLKNKTAFLVVDDSADPVTYNPLQKTHLDSLFAYFDTHGIDKDRIIALTPSPTDKFFWTKYLPNYAKLTEPQTTKPYFKHLTHNRLIDEARWDLKLALESNRWHFPPSKPIKHFICLSRRDSINRQTVNTFIHSRKLFEKGIVTHQRIGEHNEKTDDQKRKVYLRVLSEHPSFNKKDFLKYGFMKHAALESDELNKLEAIHSFQLHLNYSSKACFEIVTETDISANMIFLTEKVFKPMISKKLFFLAGNPNSLRFLRKCGFRTFSDIIDESYDSELVFYTRISKMFDSIEELCKLSIPELQRKLEQIDDVLEHNYNHLLNTSWDFNLVKRIQQYIDEVNF